MKEYVTHVLIKFPSDWNRFESQQLNETIIGDLPAMIFELHDFS